MSVYGETSTTYYPAVKDRMSRARTPLGAVPISTIYGYDYPLRNGMSVSRDILSKHEDLKDCVDYMVRSSRAFSENRMLDPYYTSSACSGLSFMPMALRSSRANSPYRSSSPIRESSPIRSVSPIRYDPQPIIDTPSPKTTSIGYTSTSPWNSTGFYYSPRYPQSYRGTASTYTPYSSPYPTRRYPVRRFVPAYVPFRFSRRY